HRFTNAERLIHCQTRTRAWRIHRKRTTPGSFAASAPPGATTKTAAANARQVTRSLRPLVTTESKAQVLVHLEGRESEAHAIHVTRNVKNGQRPTQSVRCPECDRRKHQQATSSVSPTKVAACWSPISTAVMQ